MPLSSRCGAFKPRIPEIAFSGYLRRITDFVYHSRSAWSLVVPSLSARVTVMRPARNSMQVASPSPF